jgi:hypothetical protein
MKGGDHRVHTSKAKGSDSNTQNSEVNVELLTGTLSLCLLVPPSSFLLPPSSFLLLPSSFLLPPPSFLLCTPYLLISELYVSKEDPMSKYNINKDRIGKGYVDLTLSKGERGTREGQGRMD